MDYRKYKTMDHLSLLRQYHSVDALVGMGMWGDSENSSLEALRVNARLICGQKSRERSVVFE